jgi:hypothetical protein
VWGDGGLGSFYIPMSEPYHTGCMIMSVYFEVLCRVVALSAASRGVLDRQTAFALKPALDQIGAVFDEAPSPLPFLRSLSPCYRFKLAITKTTFSFPPSSPYRNMQTVQADICNHQFNGRWSACNPEHVQICCTALHVAFSFLFPFWLRRAVSRHRPRAAL